MKVKRFEYHHRIDYQFMCPGCNRMHGFVTEWKPISEQKEPTWTFNGDVDKPTFAPSLLYNQSRSNPNHPVCHLFVRDGRIEFLSDCTHHMAGKTVDMADIKEQQ